MILYRTHEDDPLITGSLRDRFKMTASLLWARGLPPPTADEIADAMVKVLVPIETKVEMRIVATRPDGKTKPWPKRNAAHAEKGILDFIEDRKRSVFWREASVHLEQREVSDWHGYGDPR